MSNVVCAILAVLIMMHWASAPNHDTTDAPDIHSGLRVYTDHATGVQYVSTMLGGVTPRIDRNGKPFMDTTH